MAVVSSVLVIVIVFITVASIASRAILGQPIIGVTEVSTLLLVVIAFLGFAYVQRTKGHIAVDMFVAKFPPRLRSLQSIFMNSINIFIFSLIMYFGIEMAKHSYLISEREVGFIPVWPIRFFVPIGSFFVVLLSVVELIEGVANLVHGRVNLDIQR